MKVNINKHFQEECPLSVFQHSALRAAVDSDSVTFGCAQDIYGYFFPLLSRIFYCTIINACVFCFIDALSTYFFSNTLKYNINVISQSVCLISLYLDNFKLSFISLVLHLYRFIVLYLT